MNCFYHSDREAIGTCKACSKGLCEECAVDLGQGLACGGRHEVLVADYNNLIEKNIKIYSGSSGNTLIVPSFLLAFGLILVWGGLKTNDGFTSFSFILGLASVVLSYFIYRRNKEIFGTQSRSGHQGISTDQTKRPLAENDALISKSGNAFSNLFHNLKAGLLLLFFVPIKSSAFRSGFRYVIYGMVFVTMISAGFDYLQSTGEVYFYYQGWGPLAAVFLVIILLAISASTMQCDFGQFPLMLTALFSTLPWYFALAYLFRDYSGQLSEITGFWIWILAWGIIAFIRVIKLTFPTPDRRSYVAVFMTLSACSIFGWNTYSFPQILYSYDNSDFEIYNSIDQETTYYRQSSLIDSKLQLLEGNTPNETDLYFLGFAGDGSSNVFQSEVEYAKTIMDKNFDTAGRSMILVNDLESLDTEPFANTHNLTLAIEGFARTMDVEEDILFIYLTSHGSTDASLSVKLYPFVFNHLSAEDILETLDRTGIEWRIIVVSACYSGSFIETLANEKTLLLTAAAANKVSFGCSTDRELTYFGEALFDGALSNGGSLIDAMNQARDLVAEREANEGLSSSDPEFVIGRQMQEKLQQAWPD